MEKQKLGVKYLNTMSDKELVPAFATHPGELIRDEMKARRLSQKALCEVSGITPSVLHELTLCKSSISEKVAQALESVLGIPTSFWLNLQKQYERDCAVIREHTRVRTK